MRPLKFMHGFSLAKIFLISFLLIWFIAAALYIHSYMHLIRGSFTDALPNWIDGCWGDPRFRDQDCDFAMGLRGKVLGEETNLVDANLRRQAFEWHHIASVIIFFVVIGAFVISLYFAYLEFLSERESPTDPSRPKLVAKFLGMEFSSSMIGLSILIISFAFFMAYLTLVYPIKSIDVDSPRGSASSTIQQPASESGMESPKDGGS